MNIGDVVVSNNKIGVVISTNPLTLATHDYKNESPTESGVSVLLSRNQVLELFKEAVCKQVR